jgi:hypothetical protein
VSPESFELFSCTIHQLFSLFIVDLRSSVVKEMPLAYQWRFPRWRAFAAKALGSYSQTISVVLVGFSLFCRHYLLVPFFY